MEEKCEELRKQIEELHREVEIERRKNERLQLEQRTKKDEPITTPVNISLREPDVCFERRRHKITINFDNHNKLAICFCSQTKI